MDRIDPTLCSLAAEFVQPGTVVWDVGANVGLFAFSAAHYAGTQGKVLAFEPDAWLVQLLRRSVSIQPQASAPVEVVPVAVAQECDLRTFHLSARSRATNALSGYGPSDKRLVRETQTVPVISLDWCAKRRALPDVIKVDVEGAELEVLTGARHILQVRRPVLVCEVWRPSSPAVTLLLKDMGYRLFNADLAPQDRSELPHAPRNTLAIAGATDPASGPRGVR